MVTGSKRVVRAPHRLRAPRGALARACFICRRPIAFCNGFVVAGDLLAYWAGILPRENVRERCYVCVEVASSALEAGTGASLPVVEFGR